MRKFLYLVFIATLLCPSKSLAQDSIPIAQKIQLHLFTGKEQIDLIDIGRYIVNPHDSLRQDNSFVKTGRIHASVLPAVQYTLQTAFEASLVGNAAFYTSNDSAANVSNMELSINYTQKHQFFVPIEGNFWTKHNKYNLLTDWQFAKFPQNTYGLGGYTTNDDGYLIDYSYVRFYQTLFKNIKPDLYIGVGYDLDYYWNVKELDPPTGITTDFEKYGISPTAVSSGITLSTLYDTRRNAINPQPGYYANISYRLNTTVLGSNTNWQSLLLDLRKYDHFPAASKNTLAFWSYDWFTLNGKPPYLNLIATGEDEYENMGRGYAQGRFRGQNLLYLESEYRFAITNNGLLGAVVFANVQSYTEIATNQFAKLLPGYGTGIRVKLNKFSNTNIALDYGWGINGSQGIFANLGEVF